MKGIQIIFQILILYGFYYLGSWVQVTFQLLMPGSIIGMLLLFCLLCTKIFKLNWIDQGASFLLTHLSLLFVPVTVGIVDFFDLFRGKGLLSVVVIIVSTITVMVVSAVVSQAIARKSEKSVLAKNKIGVREEL
ncbi:CidA/LrgA family protein [Bacillus sp. Marseille-P3661]|uniref:CidA/LrgA family protein n=1 Tax=Bacillus sp. Marseille-P3661 TaxID=1936234 RepID=UPI000C861212|nr:CidA/LrgA family protein [Bacillus sp. Marseille-P3661]